jgi:ABC transporter, permease protein
VIILEVYNILWRSYKWRRNNLLSVLITILQPILWLVLYGSIANFSLEDSFHTNYSTFIIPGLVVLVTFSSSSSGGMVNYIMKKNGSFKRLMISPIKKESIIIGQIMESTACSLLESLILMVIGLFIGVNYKFTITSFFLTTLLIIMTGLTFSLIAYYISLTAFNEVIYETIMNMIVLPIFFLSSALFPIENISGFFKVVVDMNIFRYVIDLIRELMQGKIFFKNYMITFIVLFIMISLMVVLNSKKLENKVIDL